MTLTASGWGPPVGWMGQKRKMMTRGVLQGERALTPLRRCHSEQVANGPIPPPHWQLSAPHIIRGTFAGPLGGSQWAQSQRREEADVSRRMQAECSTDKEAQGQQFHHHRVSATGTRDKDGLPGPPRYHSAADCIQRPTRNADPAVASPHHWQAKGGQGPRLLPDPGSPRLA
ncbi:Protein FAM83G [Plecturocebus cupreus]